MKVWLNGAIVEQTHATVSAFDHGLTVGDGVFETVKVVGGTPFALSRHLDRLTRSAAGLGLPLPETSLLRRAVGEVLEAHQDLGDARLRIMLTGGMAPLGSDRDVDVRPTLFVGIQPLTAWPATADVVTTPWTRNERSPTAGLKTTSYADNVVALQYAHERGAGEAVFGNSRGKLCEGTGSNIFVVIDGTLLTPPLAAGCLAGVTRDLLLEWLPEAAEEDLQLSALAIADEAFLTSSTRDIQPVARIDGRLLPAVPGPLTKHAMNVFAEQAGVDPDP